MHEALAEDVNDAVEAAAAALKGPWGKMTKADRCDLLMKLADAIDARKAEFMEAEVADTGLV